VKNLIKNFHKIYSKPFLKAETISDLEDIFQQICIFQKIRCFAIAEVKHDETSPERKFYTYSNYPKEWTDKYMYEKYYELDPVLRNPAVMPLPVYWDSKFLDKLDDIDDAHKHFWDQAHAFDITNGTTIPLTPHDKKNAYLTVLDVDLTSNFDVLFWLRNAGDIYLNKRNEILCCQNQTLKG
jgi:hypothetical protein